MWPFWQWRSVDLILLIMPHFICQWPQRRNICCVFFAYMEDWQTQPMSLNTEYDSLQSKIALCFIIYSELPKIFFFLKTIPLFKKRTIPRIPGCWLIKLVICAIKACTWISFVKILHRVTCLQIPACLATPWFLYLIAQETCRTLLIPE